MPLNAQQLQIARQLYTLAVQRGLPPARAREFAAAAYAESGLSPTATNKSSGAAGLFQLLSSGYRQRAKQLGGLYDVRANALAILPNYMTYWRQHPNAAPGEGGRDVELSGEGAGFYSSPLSLLRALGGAGAATAGAAETTAPTAAGAVSPALRSMLLRALSSDAEPDWYGMAREARASRSAPRTATAGSPVETAAAASTPVSGNYVFPKMERVSGKTPLAGLDVSGADWRHEDTALLTKLSQVARQLGVPITIFSGYRAPGYISGGYNNDPHMRGVAVDATINGVPIGQFPGAMRLLKAAGLESGNQPGFYRGKTDPAHVQIPGSGVNKRIHARSYLR